MSLSALGSLGLGSLSLSKQPWLGCDFQDGSHLKVSGDIPLAKKFSKTLP